MSACLSQGGKTMVSDESSEDQKGLCCCRYDD